MEKIILYILTATVIGCSTTHRSKALTYMGGAFLGGAVIGATQAPDGDNQNMHGLMWGAAASAIAGASLIYLYDENREIREQQYKIRELETKLGKSDGDLKVKANGESAFLETRLPKEYSHLVEPGKWKIYQINEWKKVSESEYVHQDKLMEIEPAKIKIEK